MTINEFRLTNPGITVAGFKAKFPHVVNWPERHPNWSDTFISLREFHAAGFLTDPW